MRVLFLAVLLLSTTTFAQEVTLSPGDSVQSVLVAQKGKRVTVRLRSGQELTGTMRESNGKVAVLGAIGGRELFDAVVPLDQIEAVLIRTKQ